MAMVNSLGSRPKISLPKQMLKDYLLDDLSSCSSSGFRTFPRRQCCVSTVRFLIDETTKKQTTLKKPKKSFLKRAINAAVKLLSITAKPQENIPAPAKVPSKLFSRWITLKHFTIKNTVSNAVIKESDDSVKITSNIKGDNYWDGTWGESNGTCNKNDVVLEERKEKEIAMVVSSESSTPASSSQNNWQNEEVKEQFSPVSVMDFPSTDEEEVSSPDEVSSSTFQSRLDCVEGKKKRLMQKLRRFEDLAKLEPMDLSKKFTSSEQTDESIDSPSSSASVNNNIMDNILEYEEEVEDQGKVVHKALYLLDQMNINSENIKFDSENILFEFFVEGISETIGIKAENELISEARDWMNGNPHEMFLGWEEEKNRLPYLRDMEKEGNWNIRNIRVSDELKEEMAMQLEVQVLALLVNDLVLDLI